MTPQHYRSRSSPTVETLNQVTLHSFKNSGFIYDYYNLRLQEKVFYLKLVATEDKIMAPVMTFQSLTEL